MTVIKRTIGTKEYSIEIRRKNINGVHLRMDAEGHIQISCPIWMTVRDIDVLLKKEENRIIAGEASLRQKESPELCFTDAENHMHSVNIVRRNTRNINLRIHTDGSLRISCPYQMPVSEIQKFIEEKRDWLNLHLQEMNRKDGFDPTGAVSGKARYLGKEYPVRIISGDGRKMEITDNEIIYYSDTKDPEVLRKIFYDHAAEDLIALVREKRKQWDKKICLAHHRLPPKITVKYMTSRWGSCTPQRNHISLSLRLMHYPVDGLDYVLLHEYVHFLVPDHSSLFYDTVSRYMPDWRQKDAVLK